MSLSIRQQTLLIALLPMMFAVMLLDAYFLHSRFSYMEAEMTGRAQLLAQQLGASSEYAMFSGNAELLQQDVEAALKQKDVGFVAIQDATGKPVAFAGDVIQGTERGVIKEQTSVGVVHDAEDYFLVREQIESPAISLNDMGAPAETGSAKLLGYVSIKMNKLSLRKAKWEVLGASLLISGLLLGLTLLFVLRISRRIVQPIRLLNQVTRSIGDGALDARLASVPAIRELGELALGINEMAKQLQEDRAALDKQSESLRANEQRLNEIINTMPVALFIKDVQGRIILMNSACEAQWGMLFEEVAGTDASQFFPPGQMDVFQARDREVLANRKMVVYEESVWNSEIKQNRTLHTFKKGVYDWDGKPLYLIGISIDISERKSAETRLQQLNEQLEARIEEATRESRLKKDEAENANFAKTRFLAAASHDLRQPMHALGLFVGELQAKLTTPEQRQLVGKVEESVDALSNLLDALLDISKLDAGVVTPDVRIFSVASLLERIANDYVPLAEHKGVTLRVIPNNTIIYSDPILLERMLVNLISNAIRYTPSGGRVMLACRNRGEQLRVEVRDNGEGIPANEQQNIFKEFVQLSNKERDRGKGLGLGLAIVNRLAKLLHHDIALRSAPGRGSVFSLAVPKVLKPVQEPMQNLASEEITQQRTPDEFDNLDVLVVDDNQLVLKSTQGILESWGCRVAIAASLQEVAKIRREADFDLVICDYRLPDSDGIEVYDWIQAHFKSQPMFILISGDTAPEVLQLVDERGIQLLHKPVRPAKLRSLIRYLLNHKL